VAKKIAKHQEFTLRSARENGDTSNNIMANIDLSLSAPDYDLKEFIRKNIQYPEIAAKNGIQGIVIVSFMVAEDGKIEYVTTIQGLGGGCTEEAIRIVKLMPPWKLANSHGRPVRAYTQLHFNF
jgi:TonB family protein